MDPKVESTPSFNQKINLCKMVAIYLIYYKIQIIPWSPDFKISKVCLKNNLQNLKDQLSFRCLNKTQFLLNLLKRIVDLEKELLWIKIIFKYNQHLINTKETWSLREFGLKTKEKDRMPIRENKICIDSQMIILLLKLKVRLIE